MIVETKQLVKQYGAHVVLSGINLAVDTGAVYGLVGPNGAGKTTLLSIISGLRRQTTGDVLVEAKKHEIAVCPDVPEFEPWLSAYEVMQLTATLVGVKRSDHELEQLLADAGLGEDMHRKVGGFSRGMTQRSALAACAVGRPKLIILDEPCSALDPAGRVEVLNLVAGMGRHATVIFSSHILADVQRVCNTIGILREGELLYQGSLEAFLNTHVKPVWNIRLRNHPADIEARLSHQPWVTRCAWVSDATLQVEAQSLEDAERHFARVLAEAGAHLVSLEPVAGDLEHAFLAITEGGER